MAGFTINQVVLSGNLTRDPELRGLPSGTSVCTLGLAVNERVKDQGGQWTDRPNYFDVTVWGGIGEWVARELHKGDQLVVHGRLRWHSWTTNDGQKRSKVDVVADSIVPMPRGGNGRSGGQQRQSSSSGEIPFDDSDFQPASSMPGADDDIPF